MKGDSGPDRRSSRSFQRRKNFGYTEGGIGVGLRVRGLI